LARALNLIEDRETLRLEFGRLDYPRHCHRPI
jgi:hypothetical protein